MKKMIVAIMLILSVSQFAQSSETVMELLRTNIKAEKKALIAEAMELSSEQSDKFWPIYNEFEYKTSGLADKKIAIIKEYAKNYENLTDEVADNLITKSFDLEEDILDLNKDYYEKVKDVLGSKYAGKFIQLISRINKLINLQLASEIPLLPTDSTNESGQTK